jgi:tripartite-type tricarboxylate transporter receptor subunit TctC
VTPPAVTGFCLNREALVFLLRWFCIALPLFAESSVILGQAYPSHPIRLVIPFAAGGTPDAIGRVLAARLEPALGQSIVIDNRAGANGIIGVDIVSKSAPDGYTLLMTSSSFVINSIVYRKLPYDIHKDFIPITNVALGLGYLLLVHPSLPANSVQELIALAGKKEGQLPYGSPGVGNSLHLAAELFSVRTGIRMVHIPYKGISLAFNALLGGEVQVLFIPPTIAIQQVKAGKARALGFTGVSRWQVLPDVPTIAEAGVPGFHMEAGWHGWFAPAKTPGEIISRLNAEIRKALQVSQVREFIIAGGYEPVGNSPSEFRQFVNSDIQRYTEIVRAANVGPE